MDEELKRYECEGRDGHMEPNPAYKGHSGGDWYWADAVDEKVAALEARVKELEEALERSHVDRRAVVREYVRNLNHLEDALAKKEDPK